MRFEDLAWGGIFVFIIAATIVKLQLQLHRSKGNNRLGQQQLVAELGLKTAYHHHQGQLVAELVLKTACHRHQGQIVAELATELIELQQLDICKGNHNHLLRQLIAITVVVAIMQRVLLIGE